MFVRVPYLALLFLYASAEAKLANVPIYPIFIYYYYYYSHLGLLLQIIVIPIIIIIIITTTIICAFNE